MCHHSFLAQVDLFDYYDMKELKRNNGNAYIVDDSTMETDKGQGELWDEEGTSLQSPIAFPWI
ncbi:MAG: hypothetical protein QW837_07265 [Conexivisphaerales archaeon]